MSLSTYTVKKVKESNIIYCSVYCMLIVLSTLLMWFLCALSGIFSNYIFFCSSSLRVFLACVPYFNWGILWDTIFTIAFSRSFFVLVCYFDFSDQQCTWGTHLLHCVAAVRPISHFRSFYIHVDRNNAYAWGCFLVLSTLNGALWFGLHCEQCSQSFLQTGFAVWMLLEASIRSNPSHQVRDAVGNLGAPNTRVAAGVHPHPPQPCALLRSAFGTTLKELWICVLPVCMHAKPRHVCVHIHCLYI